MSPGPRVDDGCLTAEIGLGAEPTTSYAGQVHSSTAGPRADHLVPLPGGPWMLWRSVCLRGAGFAVADLLRLAAPESARIADLLIDEESRARRASVERARRALAVADGDRSRRRRLKKALKRLEAELLPPTSPDRGEDGEEREARARLEDLGGRLALVFAAEELEVGARLRHLASAPAFREAVLWQNRHAFRTAVEPFLKTPSGAGDRKRERAREHLVASYLQRYCVKNDSVGFFGPVGWGRIVDRDPAFVLEPGPALLAQRRIYFEGWCIDALAQRLTESAVLQAWIAPRLLPDFHLEGCRLRIAGLEPVDLSPHHARLLALCDGERTAKAIAELLVAEPSVPFASVSEVYELLDLSRRSRLITWTLEGPLELHPERRLRERLEAVGDDGARTSCVAALAELEGARAALAAGAGQVEALDRALDDLETTFTRLTGTSPTRRHGQTYAARTLVYEDCRRDVKLEIGPALLSRLGPALSLVLTAARWVTWEMARRDCEELERAYAELAGPNGSRAVDLTSVALRSPSLSGKEDAELALTGAVQAELQQRWSEVLGPPGDVHEVHYRSDALRPRVAEAFAAHGTGWRWPRYVSPDVMIAAPDVECINRGDCQIVLGEVHLLNTLLNSCLVTQHPEPGELLAALEQDHPEPCVVAVLGKEIGQRTNIGVLSAKDFYYESTPDTSAGLPPRVLRAGELVLQRGVEGLEVRTLDGRARFDILDFFGHLLTYRPRLMQLNPLSLPTAQGHGPRVVVDGVVLARERWQFVPPRLGFAWQTDRLARFLAVRRWARAHGLPRFVFFKVPVERKPCYADLDSPLYVDILCKLIRQTGASSLPDATVSLTEMLPRIDEAWLVDAQGRHYTSELRLAALDP